LALVLNWALAPRQPVAKKRWTAGLLMKMSTAACPQLA
jgi:hypothetical protein